MKIIRIIMSGWLSVCFVFVCFVCGREKEIFREREVCVCCLMDDGDQGVRGFGLIVFGFLSFISNSHLALKHTSGYGFDLY